MANDPNGFYQVIRFVVNKNRNEIAFLFV